MDVHIEMEQKGTTCSCLLESTLYVKSKEKPNKKQQVTMDISMIQNSSRITIFFFLTLCDLDSVRHIQHPFCRVERNGSVYGDTSCVWALPLTHSLHSDYDNSSTCTAQLPAVSLEAWGPQRNLSSTTAKEWGPCSLHLSKSHRIMMEQKSSTYKQLLHGCQHPLCTIFIVDLTNVFLLERIPDGSENFILSAWTEKREYNPSFKCTAVCTC